ncbi:MAG: hypothetical protein FJY55_10190 [Betaproteobacteria bacterium]|nr:hypothetical protein [Betaproteobacteria bacterium]
MRVEYSPEAVDWVACRLPEVGSGGFSSNTQGVAVVAEGDRSILAGAVYHDYYPDYGTIQISLAAATPRWASRRIIGQILSIAFERYGCHKIWASTLHSNSHALRFILGVGFEKEALLTDFFGPGRHSIATSMTRDQWAERYTHGQKVSIASAAA